MINQALNKLYSKINMILIFMYKIAGAALLSLTAMAILAYAILFVFYAFNRSWAMPIILTPAHEQVLSFQSRIVDIENMYNLLRINYDSAKTIKLLLTKHIKEIEHLLHRTKKSILVESENLNVTRKSLEDLVSEQKKNINQTNISLVKAQEMIANLEQELKAGLITRSRANEVQIQLQSAINAETNSRIASADLDEKINALQARSTTLKGGATSIAAITDLSQELKLTETLDEMKIKLETAIATLEVTQTSVENTEQFLKAAKESPYYAAFNNTVNVLFIQYDNLRHVKVGDPIYDCYLQILMCHRVGTVRKLYADEQYAKHPLFRTDIKGVFALVDIDTDAARSLDVFIGRKPLFL
jgi:hypothetical protein